MRPPDKALIVTVLVPTTSDGPMEDGPWDGEIGTGCAVGDGLILTARHVVAPPNRNHAHPIRIRWYNQRQDGDPLSAWIALEEDDKAIRWIGEGELDAALLVCPRHGALREMRGYRVAVACPAGNVDWESRGFPKASVVGEESGHGDFIGKVMSMGQDDPLFSLASELRAGDAWKDWSGVSGMPVLVDETIVGIVKSVPDKFGNQMLNAVPCFRMCSDPDFCEALGFKDLPDLVRRARVSTIRALKQGAPATRALARRLAPDCGSLDTCCEILAERALQLPLKTLVDTALEVQADLRAAGEDTEADFVARFILAVLPTGVEPAEVGKIASLASSADATLIRLDAHSPTLVEILMAAADGRAAWFRPLHDRRAAPRGEGCLGHVEGGRDPQGIQRASDLTTELGWFFEPAFTDDLDAVFFGHLRCIVQYDWHTPPTGQTDQERAAFDEGLIRKINEELEWMALDRQRDGRSFTLYLVVETPASLSDAERGRRDAVLGRIKARFPRIAILCTAPKPTKPWEELDPFGNLRALLYKRPKSDR